MIMEGSGIEKAFKTIYGSNTAKQMLVGKAISRANRAHILTESALMIKLQKIALEDVDAAINIEEISKLYNDVVQQAYRGVPKVSALFKCH